MPATSRLVSRKKRSVAPMRPIRFKATSVTEDGTFEGYGNVFNVVDSYGDIVLPGAFAESLADHKANGTMPKLLLHHDAEKPIGSWLEMFEDEHGLYCKGQLILDVESARETQALMKAGAIDGLSIGGEPSDTEKRMVHELPGLGIYLDEGEAAENGQVRLVHTWHLWEVSVVTFPACEPALIDRDTVKRRVRAARPDRKDAAELARLARQVAANGRALARLHQRHR